MLMEKGRTNGVPGMRLVSAEEMRRCELTDARRMVATTVKVSGGLVPYKSGNRITGVDRL